MRSVFRDSRIFCFALQTILETVKKKRKKIMMTVNTADFVSALKSLKVHLKARRKLNILIRGGNDVGELILELSGKSRYSGILTTVYGTGDWDTDALVPVASLRALMLYPPTDQTMQIAFSNGRFRVGAWTCSAKVKGC